jgi:hypothetical protein
LAHRFYQFGGRAGHWLQTTHETKRVPGSCRIIARQRENIAGAGMAQLGLHRFHDGAGAGLLGALWTDKSRAGPIDQKPSRLATIMNLIAENLIAEIEAARWQVPTEALTNEWKG